MSGMNMRRKYCSIQLCHTIPSSASAVFLLCVWAHVLTDRHRQTDRQTDRQRERERERERETHTHTRTHTRARACAHAKPANLLQCQISGCNAHWQYQASVNNNLH